jgi:protein-disulfide isomerase
VAASQGKFWEMHDLLYENQRRLGAADLHSCAEQLGLDVGAFDEDLATHAFADRVQEDFMSSARSGGNGTPTFYVNSRRHDAWYQPESLLAALGAEARLTSRTGGSSGPVVCGSRALNPLRNRDFVLSVLNRG